MKINFHRFFIILKYQTAVIKNYIFFLTHLTTQKYNFDIITTPLFYFHLFLDSDQTFLSMAMYWF